MPDERAGDPDDRGSTIAYFAGAAGPGSMPNRYGPGVVRNTSACAAQITHSGAPITDLHQIAITVPISGYLRACADQHVQRTVTRFLAWCRACRLGADSDRAALVGDGTQTLRFCASPF